MKFAIVAIGYNRSDSMERLLHNLSRVDYLHENIDLFISIDYSGSDEVVRVAERFVWQYGNKEVKAYKTRLGLRNHILQCGELLRNYDAIAVFEDDIIPSIGFYSYMRETVAKYFDDKRIAGISLYQHRWNVNANLPFEPDLTEYDVFFMQFAQSWGQIWMKNQWFDFMDWYESVKDDTFDSNRLPEYVNKWPESSWLKYHIKYCVEKNKYFVYPYSPLSTNCSEVGEHCSNRLSKYQVPLLNGVKNDYRLPYLSNSCVIYDVFFERALFEGNICGIPANDIEIDLYGQKTNYTKRYVITKKELPYRMICSFGLNYRPHEVNILLGSFGNDVYMYDLLVLEKKDQFHRNAQINNIEYYFRRDDTKTIEYQIGRTILTPARAIKSYLKKLKIIQ